MIIAFCWGSSDGASVGYGTPPPVALSHCHGRCRCRWRRYFLFCFGCACLALSLHGGGEAGWDFAYTDMYVYTTQAGVERSESGRFPVPAPVPVPRLPAVLAASTVALA